MSQSANTGSNPGQIIIEVSRDGRPDRRIVQRQHSYTDNWFLAMNLLVQDDNTVTLTDVTGTDQNFDTGNAVGPWENDTMRVEIGIGSDSAAFSQTDNSLGTQIDTQSVTTSATETSNQLVRGSASYSITASDTIRETGLFWRNLRDAGSAERDIMYERTVLDTPVDVADGDTVSVTYELTWQAP